MKKTLYSLMLSEDVVREVDALAHRLGTNRSNLINQILADYVSVTTPERRINDIFQAVEQMLAPSRELVPFFAPNALTMSLKSSLEYKYRPTVKYEVQLFRSGEGSLGELSVVFRTQSAALIEAMTGFFRLWKYVEDKLLAPLLAENLDYAPSVQEQLCMFTCAMLSTLPVLIWNKRLSFLYTPMRFYSRFC